MSIIFRITIAVLLLCGLQSSAQVSKIKKEVQTGYVPDGQGNLVADTTENVKLYDIKQNVVEETDKSFWPMLNKFVNFYKKHFYSPNGRYDSTLTFVDGKRSLKLEPHYDSAGREIETREITAEGKRGYMNRNFFIGRSKRKSRLELYGPDGKQQNLKTFKYDKKGNLIEESGFEKGAPRYRWLSKYDTKNHLVERNDFAGDGSLVQKHKYEYDANGRIYQETLFGSSGERVKVIKYSYEYY